MVLEGDASVMADLKGRLSKALFEYNSRFASCTSGALVQVWLPEVCSDGTVVLSAQGLPFAIAGVGDLLALFRCVSCRYRFSTDHEKPGLMGAIGRVYSSCEPEMSHNVQKYDKQVYLRVTEAQRCRVHSTLVMPIFSSPSSRSKPVAVFELVQSDKDVAFPEAMSWLRSCLAEVGLYTTEAGKADSDPAVGLRKWPMDVNTSLLLDEFGPSLGAARQASMSVSSAGRLLPENDGDDATAGTAARPGASSGRRTGSDDGRSDSFTSAPKQVADTLANAASADAAAMDAAAPVGPAASEKRAGGAQQQPAMKRQASAPLPQRQHSSSVVKMETEATAESEGAQTEHKLGLLRLHGSSKDLAGSSMAAPQPQQQQGQQVQGLDLNAPAAPQQPASTAPSSTGAGAAAAAVQPVITDDSNSAAVMQALQQALLQQQRRINQQQQQQQAPSSSAPAAGSSGAGANQGSEGASPALLSLLATSMQSMLSQHALQAFKLMQEQMATQGSTPGSTTRHNSSSSRGGPMRRSSSRTVMSSGGKDHGDDGDEDLGSDGGASDNEEHEGDRSRQGGGARPPGAGRRLTYEDLQAQFGMGLKEAAANLGVCATTLKRACRRNGITRWPRRQIAKLSRTLNQMGYTGAPPPVLMQSAAAGNLSTSTVMALGAAAGLQLNLPNPQAAGGPAAGLLGTSAAPQAIPGVQGHDVSSAHFGSSLGPNGTSLSAAAGSSFGSLAGPHSLADACASASNVQLLAQQVMVPQPLGPHSFPGAFGAGPGPLSAAVGSGPMDSSSFAAAFSVGGLSAPDQLFANAFGSGKAAAPASSMGVPQQQVQQQQLQQQGQLLDDPTLRHLDSLLMQDLHDPNPHGSLDSFLDMIGNDNDDMLTDAQLADGQLGMLAGPSNSVPFGGGFVSAFGGNRCGLAPISESPHVPAGDMVAAAMDVEAKAPLH